MTVDKLLLAVEGLIDAAIEGRLLLLEGGAILDGLTGESLRLSVPGELVDGLLLLGHNAAVGATHQRDIEAGQSVRKTGADTTPTQQLLWQLEQTGIHQGLSWLLDGRKLLLRLGDELALGDLLLLLLLGEAVEGAGGLSLEGSRLLLVDELGLLLLLVKEELRRDGGGD